MSSGHLSPIVYFVSLVTKSSSPRKPVTAGTKLEVSTTLKKYLSLHQCPHQVSSTDTILSHSVPTLTYLEFKKATHPPLQLLESLPNSSQHLRNLSNSNIKSITPTIHHHEVLNRPLRHLRLRRQRHRPPHHPVRTSTITTTTITTSPHTYSHTAPPPSHQDYSPPASSPTPSNPPPPTTPPPTSQHSLSCPLPTQQEPPSPPSSPTLLPPLSQAPTAALPPLSHPSLLTLLPQHSRAPTLPRPPPQEVSHPAAEPVVPLRRPQLLVLCLPLLSTWRLVLLLPASLLPCKFVQNEDQNGGPKSLWEMKNM